MVSPAGRKTTRSALVNSVGVAILTGDRYLGSESKSVIAQFHQLGGVLVMGHLAGATCMGNVIARLIVEISGQIKHPNTPRTSLGRLAFQVRVAPF